ncbi:hypothetical protein [Ferrimonas senticii]|uniref:ApeI family dehydratase n=1 Tax=Ferrimonas senticii TaxID=394566 RepID=UPI0003FA0551|nr:hypothetical protein [Ferrimonas senticii]
MFNQIEPIWLDYQQSPGRWHLPLRIQPQLDYLRGHFQQAPVLPGVVQIHWAIQQAQLRFGFGRQVAQLEKVKFQQVVHPDETLILELERIGDRRIGFRFFQDQRRFSSGVIHFVEPRP